MILIVMFDKNADIVDVPQSVIDNKDVLRKKFLRWIYSKNNPNRQKANTDINGRIFCGVKYRSDSFVDWLNKKVLHNSDDQAYVLSQQVSDYPPNAPILFF